MDLISICNLLKDSYIRNSFRFCLGAFRLHRTISERNCFILSPLKRGSLSSFSRRTDNADRNAFLRLRLINGFFFLSAGSEAGTRYHYFIRLFLFLILFLVVLIVGIIIIIASFSGADPGKETFDASQQRDFTNDKQADDHRKDHNDIGSHNSHCFGKGERKQSANDTSSNAVPGTIRKIGKNTGIQKSFKGDHMDKRTQAYEENDPAYQFAGPFFFSQDTINNGQRPDQRKHISHQSE